MEFEEALKKLEKIVEELEGKKSPADNSLKRYEEGIRLSRFCRKSLQAAQGKIQDSLLSARKF